MSGQRWRPPEHYIHAGGDVVVVPARVAALLLRHARIDQLRTQLRGADAELDSVLVALTVAALHWRTSATGSEIAPTPEARAQSPWMSTTQAAEHLGITDRAVRLAISERRLAAEQVDGRWRISREDVEHYRAARAA
jgi:excisionase family DNA binding protein